MVAFRYSIFAVSIVIYEYEENTLLSSSYSGQILEVWEKIGKFIDGSRFTKSLKESSRTFELISCSLYVFPRNISKVSGRYNTVPKWRVIVSLNDSFFLKKCVPRENPQEYVG